MSRLSKHSQSTISRMVASVNRPDTTERATFLRKWLARHQRTLAKGGLAASLTLPLMAQAATQDGKVALESIDAITDMARKQDGSLLIQLEDGRLLEVSAEHVTQAEGQTLVDVAALRQAEQEAWIALEDLPNVESATVNSDGSVTVTRTDGTEVVLEEGIATSASGMAVASQEQLTAEGLVSPGDYSSLEGLSAAETGASQASAWSSAMGNISPAMAAGAGAVAVGAVAIAANSSSSSSSPTSSPSSDSERVLELEGNANFDDLDLAGIDVIKVSEDAILRATTADLDGFSGRIEGAGDVAINVGQEETLATNIQLSGGTLTFDFSATDVKVLELTSESTLRLGGGDLIVTGGTLDVSNIENPDDFSEVSNVTLNSGLTVNVDQLASLEQISTETVTESSFNVVIRSQQDLDKLSSLDLSGKFSDDDDGLSVSFKVEADTPIEQRSLEIGLQNQKENIESSTGKTIYFPEVSPLPPLDFSSSQSIDSVRQYLSALTNEDIGDKGDNLLYGELTDITLSTGETLTVQKVPDKDNLVYLEDGINYHTLDNDLTLVTIEFLKGSIANEEPELVDWGYTQWLVFDEYGFITRSNSFFPEPGNIIAAVQNDDPSTVYFQSLHIDVEDGVVSYPDESKLFTLYSLSSDNLLDTLSSVEGDKNSLIGADSVTAVLPLGADDLDFTLGDNEDVFVDKVNVDGDTIKLLVAKNDANDDESFYLVTTTDGDVTEFFNISDKGVGDDMSAALAAFDSYVRGDLDLDNLPGSNGGSGSDDQSGSEPPPSNDEVKFENGTVDFSNSSRGLEIDLEYGYAGPTEPGADFGDERITLSEAQENQLAQSALGRSLSDGEEVWINQTIKLNDGSYFLGVEFTQYPYTFGENYLARLNIDQSFDTAAIDGFPVFADYAGGDSIYLLIYNGGSNLEDTSPLKLDLNSFTTTPMTWDAFEQAVDLTYTDNAITWEPDGSIANTIGTQFDDVIFGSSEDNVIRGLGGDDEIDLSAGGNNSIIFEATSDENGTDRILGFSTGEEADRIAIATDQSLAFQSLDTLDDLNQDTGFAVFTTGSAADVLGTLEGSNNTLYFMAANDEGGSDASLYRFEGGVSEKLAVFDGLGDQLSSFGQENLQDYNSITM